MKDYRYLFIDLDGTLIETQSGSTFPKGLWDMRFRFDVFEAIKRMSPEIVFIVSNQGGIDMGYVNKVCFEAKLDYVKATLFEYCDVSVYATYCPSNDKADPMRKPNGRMLTKLWEDALADGEVSSVFEECKGEMLMVGDASGGENDFSDSDLSCADRVGIGYMDVEDFVVSFY